MSTRLERLSGTFRISTSIDGTLFVIGNLVVFEAEHDSDGTESAAGQWWFESTPSSPIVANALRDVGTRLGMLPVGLAPKFRKRLDEPAPLCLVGDTNAVRTGTLLQCVRLRRGMATEVAVADQSFMEMQRQREVSSGNTAAKAIPVAGAASFPVPAPQAPDATQRLLGRTLRMAHQNAGARSIRSLRERGHIVHVARPPEAMVRYFGGNTGLDGSPGEAPDEDVASNMVRDRLVLEAAIARRATSPGMDVLLVTQDGMLATHASMEGIAVGYVWPCDTGNERVTLTSPFINPRLLTFEHVPVATLLDELLWAFGEVELQEPHASRRLVGRVPNLKNAKRTYVLHMLQERVADLWHEEKADPIDTGSEPAGAPAAVDLLRGLIELQQGVAPLAKGVATFLEHLGWLEGGKLTKVGNEVASAWLTVDVADGDSRGTSLALERVAESLRNIPRVKRLIGVLAKKRGLSDIEIAKAAEISRTSAETYLRLMSLVDLTIRFEPPKAAAKNCVCETYSPEAAQGAILEAMTALGPGGKSVMTKDVLFYFTRAKQRPMGVQAFRAALRALYHAKKVDFSGSVPKGSGTSVHVLERVASPEYVKSRKVDVESGAYWVPGVSAKTMEVRT